MFSSVLLVIDVLFYLAERLQNQCMEMSIASGRLPQDDCITSCNAFKFGFVGTVKL
jgi:hypothetical protein